MEHRTSIPLARRLGPLEVVDAAVWFARDRAAGFLATAGSGGLAFGLGLIAFFNRMTAFRTGEPVAGHLPELAGWGAALAALYLARGFSHWAGVELLAGSLRGENKTPEECWLAALKRPASALYLAGVPAMAQWAGFLLVWPGLSFLNRTGLALPAAVFERLEPGRALRRSRDLMHRSVDGMAVWGFLFLAWAFLFVNSLIAAKTLPGILRTFFGLSLPRLEAALSPGNPLFVVAAAAVTWAITDALRVAAFAILYLNARIEKEGGDLMGRLEVLGAGRRAATPEPTHV